MKVAAIQMVSGVDMQVNLAQAAALSDTYAEILQGLVQRLDAGLEEDPPPAPQLPQV